MSNVYADTDTSTGTKPYILSMGGGVNTTALLLHHYERYTECIMADTHGEHDATYQYVEKYLKPFCVQHGIRWTTVESHKSDGDLLKHMEEKKTYPSPQFRWCTTHFKIRPINKHIRDTYHPTKRDPIHQDIGIAYDEYWRANPDSEPKYIIKHYPLVDEKITRRDCINIIEKHGWPVPPKSGCWYCFYMKKSKWRELSYKSPEKFIRIVKMEERGYKSQPYTGERMLRHLSEQNRLDTWTNTDGASTDDDDTPYNQDDACTSGHCFI